MGAEDVCQLLRIDRCVTDSQEQGLRMCVNGRGQLGE